MNRETQFETGYIDLINRQFDPQTGRFVSQDPVTDGQEHLSLYQYGWNNPVLKPDPNGLEPPCCDNLPVPKVTSDATSVSKGTPIPLNTPYGGIATPAVSLSISAGKQVGIQVGKFSLEANFGSKEIFSSSTPIDNNTSVTTSGVSVGYGLGSIGGEKKVTVTQGDVSVPSVIKGLPLKASSTITTENSSNMSVGIGKTGLSANMESSKTTTSYGLPIGGIITKPTVTGSSSGMSVGGSFMKPGSNHKTSGGTEISVGFIIKFEIKVDLKQAWENTKKYGL